MEEEEEGDRGGEDRGSLEEKRGEGSCCWKL